MIGWFLRVDCGEVEVEGAVGVIEGDCVRVGFPCGADDIGLTVGDEGADVGEFVNVAGEFVNVTEGITSAGCDDVASVAVVEITEGVEGWVVQAEKTRNIAVLNGISRFAINSPVSIV